MSLGLLRVRAYTEAARLTSERGQYVPPVDVALEWYRQALDLLSTQTNGWPPMTYDELLKRLEIDPMLFATDKPTERLKGRTTRMLLWATQVASEGRPVVIVSNDPRRALEHETQVRGWLGKVGGNPGIVTGMALGNTDDRLRGNDADVFADHQALETIDAERAAAAARVTLLEATVQKLTARLEQMGQRATDPDAAGVKVNIAKAPEVAAEVPVRAK